MIIITQTIKNFISSFANINITANKAPNAFKSLNIINNFIQIKNAANAKIYSYLKVDKVEK
jgi:hypothetical protein